MKNINLYIQDIQRVNILYNIYFIKKIFQKSWIKKKVTGTLSLKNINLYMQDINHILYNIYFIKKYFEKNTSNITKSWIKKKKLLSV